MRSVNLVPKTVEEARAAVEAMAPADKAELSPVWLERIYSSAVLDQWTLGYALVRQADGAVVGQCGFKGPPDAEGIVEIGYGVVPEFQGRGYATEAAQALVAFAFGCSRVRTVLAHTFEHSNASTRVLSKSGFRCIGEVVDPEDGLVWRWEKKREKA